MEYIMTLFLSKVQQQEVTNFTQNKKFCLTMLFNPPGIFAWLRVNN